VVKYNDTANRQNDYNRIYRAVALVLLSACTGMIIRGQLDYNREDYLETPVETNKGVYFSRINIHSNRPLLLMKSNKELKEWLIDKNLELEVKDLMEIKIANVGMI
jgi:hypothetical protein